MRAVIAVCALLAAGWAVAAATGPDTVVIDDVSHWFMPVEFDHAGHVDMAEACTTCHHDQEPGDETACGDCHLAEYDPAAPDVPDLKMAFHRNCLGCHDENGATLACVDCHARKALPEGPELKGGAMK